MLFGAWYYSSLWEEYVVLFSLGFGILLTCMTAHLNLSSVAGYNYNWFYVDPIVFFVILYCEYNQIFP
jgi:hypothetical protein